MRKQNRLSGIYTFAQGIETAYFFEERKKDTVESPAAGAPKKKTF